MGLHFDGEYFSKARDVGPHVPPSIPSDKYKENYDQIQWDKPREENQDGRGNRGN